MGLLDLFKMPGPDAEAQQAASARRQADIVHSLRSGGVPTSTRTRLEAARSGISPWIATLTPAELLIAGSHGIKPIASVSATAGYITAGPGLWVIAKAGKPPCNDCGKRRRQPAPT